MRDTQDFPPQVAILAGDFLLARASVTLAALRDSEVIQLLSQVIEDLVTGEILQVCLQNKKPSGLLHKVALVTRCLGALSAKVPY